MQTGRDDFIGIGANENTAPPISHEELTEHARQDKIDKIPPNAQILDADVNDAFQAKEGNHRATSSATPSAPLSPAPLPELYRISTAPGQFGKGISRDELFRIAKNGQILTKTQIWEEHTGRVYTAEEHLYLRSIFQQGGLLPLDGPAPKRESSGWGSLIGWGICAVLILLVLYLLVVFTTPHTASSRPSQPKPPIRRS